MIELTEQNLKDMTSEKIIATGTGTYLELYTGEIRWVAKRGDTFHDWAIYYHLPDKSIGWICQQGDKCFTESVIKRLVPCSKKAYALYRR